MDAGRGCESACETVIDFCEDLGFLVGDKDHREILNAVQVVQQALVLELVDFVEDNNVLWAGVVSQAVEQHVFWCGLPVDVDGVVDAVEDAVQCFEAAVVFPAVHVLVIQINYFLAESFDSELRDTGFPGSGRSVQERRISSFTVGERAQHAGERVDLGVPVFHLAGDEFRLEYAGVRYHGLSTRHAIVLNGSVSFPNLPDSSKVYRVSDTDSRSLRL